MCLYFVARHGKKTECELRLWAVQSKEIMLLYICSLFGIDECPGAYTMNRADGIHVHYGWIICVDYKSTKIQYGDLSADINRIPKKNNAIHKRNISNVNHEETICRRIRNQMTMDILGKVTMDMCIISKALMHSIIETDLLVVVAF